MILDISPHEGKKEKINKNCLPKLFFKIFGWDLNIFYFTNIVTFVWRFLLYLSLKKKKKIYIYIYTQTEGLNF